MTTDKVSPPNDDRRASYERFDVLSIFRYPDPKTPYMDSFGPQISFAFMIWLCKPMEKVSAIFPGNAQKSVFRDV